MKVLACRRSKPQNACKARPYKNVDRIQHVIVVVEKNAGALVDFQASEGPIHGKNVLRAEKDKNDRENQKNNDCNDHVLRELWTPDDAVVRRQSFLGFQIVYVHGWRFK